MKSIVVNVNEAAITGVKKDTPKEIIEEKIESEVKSMNMLFAGSIIRSGHALAVVCRTGEACLINKLKKATE